MARLRMTRDDSLMRTMRVRPTIVFGPQILNRFERICEEKLSELPQHKAPSLLQQPGSQLFRDLKHVSNLLYGVYTVSCVQNIPRLF